MKQPLLVFRFLPVVPCLTFIFQSWLCIFSFYWFAFEGMVETHWRMEFASDPISKLPSFIGFEPFGVRVLLDQAGWLMIDPSLVEVEWWGRGCNPLLAQKLHYRAAYLRGLQVFARRCRDSDRGLEGLIWAFPLESQVGGMFPED